MRKIRIAGGVAAGLLITGMFAAPGTAAYAATTCNRETVTILGTEGADTIVGTAGRDVISAGGGNDTVRSLGGNDVVCLGMGNDTFFGGDGDDVVLAEATIDGTDTLNGGPGVDTATYGFRTVRMSLSIDGVANDGLGGEFDNIGTDIEGITGGAGGDTLNGNDGPNIIRGLEGIDQINGFGGVDDLFGNEGRDTISDGPGSDSVSGGADDDFFIAEPTADGPDFYFGDTGSDTVSYQRRTVSVFVTLDGTANDGALGENDRLEFDVENVVGGSGGDVLSVLGPGLNGMPADQRLSGGPGQDIIDVADGLFNTFDVADGGSDVDVCTINAEFDRKFNCEL